MPGGYGINVLRPLGSGWRPSPIGNHWDHEQYKGWTIVRNLQGCFNIVFDNRIVGEGFTSLQEVIHVGDVVVSLLNKGAKFNPSSTFNQYDPAQHYYDAMGLERIEYIALDCMNNVLGYFRANDRDAALKVVKRRYPSATWFTVVENGRYYAKGSKYVPVLGRR